MYLAESGSGAKKISTQISIDASQNIQAIAVEKPNCIPFSENQPGSKAHPKLITVKASNACFAILDETTEE